MPATALLACTECNDGLVPATAPMTATSSAADQQPITAPKAPKGRARDGASEAGERCAGSGAPVSRYRSSAEISELISGSGAPVSRYRSSAELMRATDDERLAARTFCSKCAAFVVPTRAKLSGDCEST